MANKEQFKDFVRKNPRLIKFVNSGEMTWQKFYEMYDLYGENEETWKDYITVPTKEKAKAASAALAGGLGFNEILSWLKGVDLDSLQSGIGSLQRVLGVLQDFGSKDNVTPKEEYKPRPLYRHFED